MRPGQGQRVHQPSRLLERGPGGVGPYVAGYSSSSSSRTAKGAAGGAKVNFLMAVTAPDTAVAAVVQLTGLCAISGCAFVVGAPRLRTGDGRANGLGAVIDRRWHNVVAGAWYG